ncbi:hypothetical protein LTR01_002432 [Friedmanniomyces endolithicus]|uniref:Rab-GAP TBC domain-containing protein n=1 Tax=Friedmanniomyces endolithicus TaxID=329885 RepID=A0AAN6FQY6_9PEZI|nr:hypothetical protein LTR01_002432 [Friedmanniomyces endolithicus]KAK0321907.1 hypothetical protein LTR82_006878 [Friedmanniomyces endolithicus]KAK0827485.1 hypothetical protein LTR73_005724 [Friedmanniomyces endolithicus]
MRSLQDASASWQDLKQYKTLKDLQEAVRLDGGHTSPAASSGLRSACWKTFLLFDSVDTVIWPKTLASSRSAYNSLRMHFLSQLDNQDELSDPMDDEADSATWTAIHKDEELRAEIQQDVDRCMPENLYFRQPDTQRTLLDILFIWAKLNPDINYRQGMHELLAPILWVVERDAIDLGPSSRALGEDATVRVVFDAESIEHDAFALFSQVMRSAKGFYEPGPSLPHAGENAIVHRSRRIFEEMLPKVDPELAQHLRTNDIVPQIFLMRWIRLLFGREFGFDDVLSMWDVIFAEDPTLEIVDHICLSMILRIRWELLDADYNSALTLLLRYPSASPDQNHNDPSQSLVLDALYLRSHPDTDGSGYLILKYTGRPLQPLHRPATPPALQRNITAFSGIPNLLDTSPSSPSFPGRRQPTNLEAVLQSTARTLYARGGKAVRGAVEEVHKRAQEIQKSPTPSLPSRAEHASRDSRMLERRLRALEKRNQMLAELLEGAVGELWDVQGLLAGPDGAERLQIVEKQREAHVEALSLAIAKVQYVQVYLGDASLPVPEMYAAEDPVEDTGEADSGPLMQSGSEGEERSGPDEVDPTRDDVLGESREHVTPVIKTSPTTTRYDAPAHDLADPSTFEVNSGETTPTNEEPAAAVPEIAVQGPATDDNSSANRSTTAGRTDAAATTSPTPTTTNEELFDTPSKRYRPALSEGSYSWMLGQDKASDSAATSASSPLGKTSALQSTKTPEKAKVGTGLFGNGDGGADGDNDGITVVHSSRRKRSGKQRAVVERLDGDHGALAADRARGAT